MATEIKCRIDDSKVIEDKREAEVVVFQKQSEEAWCPD